MDDDRVSVEDLKNIGPRSAEWLRAVGISTRADLQRAGAVVAFQLVQKDQGRTSLNQSWLTVPEQVRRTLRREAGQGE